MALIQNKLYVKNGYVDESMSVASFNELLTLDSGHRFNGQTVTVTNIIGAVPADFWLVNGTNKFSWRLKKVGPLASVEDLEALANICVASSSTKTAVLIPAGFEATLADGETYVFKEDGTWEKKISEDEIESALYWETDEE